MQRINLLLLLIFVCFVTEVGAQTALAAQERRIQLEDLTRIVTVSDPQISPDGKSIVLSGGTGVQKTFPQPLDSGN